MIVVDTNIVFAAIHSANSLTREKLLTSAEKFVSSRFLFIEIFKHKERIFKNSRATEDEIQVGNGGITGRKPSTKAQRGNLLRFCVLEKLPTDLNRRAD